MDSAATGHGSPLKNPRHETYCVARAEGATQRQAMLRAYPRRQTWKPATIDKEACGLEARPDVAGRIEALKREVARAATIRRADVLDGMGRAFQVAAERVAQAEEGTSLEGAAVSAVSNIGRALLDNLPADEPDEAPEFVRDMALMIAPPHLAPHRAVMAGAGGDYWLFGGRLSGKSSYISLEIVNLLMRNPTYSALVNMKVGKDMRGSVYEQMSWALSQMGVADEWVCTVSPMKMVRASTGQAIVFHGCDAGEKSKGVKAPAGTYFAVVWFEESDQFDGMAEIRTVQQSATRGAGSDAPFFRFYSFNPPRTKDSWANKAMAERVAKGLPVYTSSYLDMPPEWVPEQFRLDAEALKESDIESYRHEYLGEAVGYGAEVFPRAKARPITDEERERLGRHCYGVDWGFAADPFVWVKVAYDPASRVLYVLDEVSGLGISNQDSAARVLARMSCPRKAEDGRVLEDAEPYAPVMCDSAEPKSIDEWRNLGIRAEAAPKQGAFSVRQGVRWLQDRSAIVIDPSCEVAARELPSYQYARTKDGELTARLPDKDNHAIDALRYAVTTLIEDRRVV